MLTVWVSDRPVGRIGPMGRGMSFAYDAGVSPADAVSLTMPVRVASYDSGFGLLPVFDTNLPEGFLRARIEQALAKRIGKVGPLDILALTGGNQIGRLRVLPEGQRPEQEDSAPEEIAALLSRPISPELVSDMLDRFALRSGVSGVMPKVLARLSDRVAGQGGRLTLQDEDWILKFESPEYPGLAAVEYWCLEVARRAGLPVTEAQLSDDGRLLAVRRFDGIPGARLGFEDFCSLNGKPAREKYDGSVETALLRRMAEFSRPAERDGNLCALYLLNAVNMGLRNGDAHLKNFALLYPDADQGPFNLAPAFDLVTTRTWLDNDVPALTLEGKKLWPDRSALLRLAGRARLGRVQAVALLTQVAEAIRDTLEEMRADLTARGFALVAERVAEAWRDGVESLEN